MNPVFRFAAVLDLAEHAVAATARTNPVDDEHVPEAPHLVWTRR